jgi:LemA protein
MEKLMHPNILSKRRGAIARGCLIGVGVAVLFALAIGGCAVGQYNGLVTAQKGVEARWSDIDNQYKRRADLVPQLVETVKGAANFERTTLNEVTEARASVGRAQLPTNLPTDEKALQAYIQAQQNLSGALGRLFAVAESYPDLKASKNFLSLQDQLEGTENRIAVARTDYIKAVQDYNTRIARFPTNIFAGLFHFERAAQFQTAEADRQAPKIEFDFQKKK